jgi:hypothetical protein
MHMSIMTLVSLSSCSTKPYRTSFAEICSEHVGLACIDGVHVCLLRAHSLQWWTCVGQNFLVMETEQGEVLKKHLQWAPMMYAKALGNDNPHSTAVWNLKPGS